MDDDKHEKEGHQGIHQETDTIYLYISVAAYKIIVHGEDDEK